MAKSRAQRRSGMLRSSPAFVVSPAAVPSQAASSDKALLPLGALMLAASMGAMAHNCPNEMKAIDAALAKNPALSAAQMDEVKRLRADGERFHKEGKHGESMSALGEAKKLLGI